MNLALRDRSQGFIITRLSPSGTAFFRVFLLTLRTSYFEHFRLEGADAWPHSGSTSVHANEVHPGCTISAIASISARSESPSSPESASRPVQNRLFKRVWRAYDGRVSSRMISIDTVMHSITRMRCLPPYTGSTVASVQYLSIRHAAGETEKGFQLGDSSCIPMVSYGNPAK